MRSTPLPPATVLCMPLSHDSQSLLLLPVINPINPTQFRFSTCGQLLQHSCNCVDIHKFGECGFVTGNRSAASATATQKALTRLFEASKQSIEKLNALIETVNTIDNNAQAATVTLHKTILLENQVGELSRACQFAKAGLVNSNLLDEFEVRALLKEMDSLPYQSAVEATEFAKPIVVTNGTTLLYILALPKVIAKEYQMLVIRPSISSGKQVDFNHGKLLVAPDETFAITSDCLTIGNTSVCAEEHLAPLNEAGCIPRILKGGNAECHYVASNRRVVELLEDGTLFLTNYNGGNRYANRPKTYVICGTQIFEEGGVNTIRCGAPLFPPPLCSACLCPMIRSRFSYYRSSTR
ncbi:hypothetical protein ACLKA7_000992 [Drosophila subpalustris]